MDDQPTCIADLVTKPMRLALVGFLVAAIGATIAVASDMPPGEPLSYVALALAVLGIGTGFIGIGWGLSTLGARTTERSRTKGNDAV